MALLDLSKFALLALLISAMVSTLGGAEMVIREVVRKISDDETCKANGDVCGPTFGDCCEGYICLGGHWPPSPWQGWCIPEGDLPDTINNNRAEAGDEAQMMVEGTTNCLPRGASCHTVHGLRCCGNLECRRAGRATPYNGICR